MPKQRHLGLDEATKTFAGAGLTLPPVPSRFANALRVIDPWCFGTRKVSGIGMYFFDRYWKEPLTRSTRAYVAFSHAGHGINSYAITYHLVDGPLALFVQRGFGGVYSNKQADRRAVNSLFRRCAALVAAVEKAKDRGLKGPPGRLLVVESTMRGLHVWGWLERPPRSAAEAKAWWSKHRSGPVEYPAGQTKIQSEDLPTVAARKWLNRTRLRCSPRSA